MSDATERMDTGDEATIGPEDYPATTRLPSLDRLRGMEVRDEREEKVGKVVDVYLDAEARYVRYLVIGTGMLGRTRGAIPVDEVRYVDTGEDDAHIVVPYSREHLAAGTGCASTTSPSNAAGSRTSRRTYSSATSCSSRSRPTQASPAGASRG